MTERKKWNWADADRSAPSPGPQIPGVRHNASGGRERVIAVRDERNARGDRQITDDRGRRYLAVHPSLVFIEVAEDGE